jgi:hypothetical protein
MNTVSCWCKQYQASTVGAALINVFWDITRWFWWFRVTCCFHLQGGCIIWTHRHFFLHHMYWNIGCPTRYRPGIEDIATKFEQEYVRCVRNVSVVHLIVATRSSGLPASGKISKEMLGSVASGTPYIIHYILGKGSALVFMHISSKTTVITWWLYTLSINLD